MKRLIMAIVIAIFLGASAIWLHAKPSSKWPTLNQVREGAGYHVYVPSFVPNGFRLQTENVLMFSKQHINYGIKSLSSDKSFDVSQKPSQNQDDLFPTKEQLVTHNWVLEPINIDGVIGYIGSHPNSASTLTMLLFTKEGVDIVVSTITPHNRKTPGIDDRQMVIEIAKSMQ